MFSPSEYLTNLRQISLLNGLVTPRGQLPAIPPIPQMAPGVGPIPVVATVPASQEQCNDMIALLAGSTVALKIAAIIGAALILTYLVRKYGRTILTSLRSKIQDIVLAIQNKISRQRSVSLLPVSQTVVMG